jgi:hypothetical protein
MADSLGNPKLTIIVDKEQAERALADLKSSGSDAAKALEASLGASLDNTSKRIKKLADDITGGGATRKLQELEKAIEHAGGVGKLTAVQFDNLAARINNLAAQGGAASPKLQQIAGSLQQVQTGGASVTGAIQNLGSVLAKDVTAGATSAAGSLGPLVSQLSALGPYGIAAAAAVAGLSAGLVMLGKAAQEAVAYGSRVADLALKSDASAEGLQKLEFAGAMVGVSMESASGGILKFQKALEESPDKINALGLSVEELKAMDPAEAFTAFAKAIASIDSPSERTAAAMSVLGRSAGELMPLLRTLGEGAGETGERLGTVLSTDMVGKLDDVDDAAATLQKTWEGLWRNIGAQVATSIDVASALLGVAEAIGAISSRISDAMPLIEGFLTAGMGFRNVAAGITGGLSEQLIQAGTARFRGYETKGTKQQVADLEAANFVGPQGRTDAELEAETRAAEAALAAEKKQQKELDRIKEAAAKRHAAEAKRLAAEEAKRAKDYEAVIRKQEQSALEADSSQMEADLDRLTKTQDARTEAVRKAQSDQLKVASRAMDAIDADAKKSLEDTKKLQEENAKGAIEWGDALQNIANSASFLPPMFRDVLGSVASAGAAIKGLDFSQKIEGGKEKFSLTGGKKFEGLLGNAMQGMQLAGVAFNLVKNIASALHKTESEKIMEDVGRDFGVNISEGLAKQIEKDTKSKGRFDATLKNLGAVIGEGGGVKAFGVENTIAKMHDLFSAMERGTLNAKEVGGVFDDVFGQLIPEAIDKTTGRLQDNARELLRMAQQRGVQSKEIEAFVGAQGNAALAGLTSFMKAADITSQGAATVIAGSISKIFDDMIATGMSRTDAIAAITPAVQQLREELTKTGYEGTAAFAALDAQIALMSDEKFGPMVEGIAGLGTAMVSLHNMNLLTQADFTALSTQVTETFNSMVAQGANADAAMAALQPTLQTIWELQQDYGLAVDESTQKLLDQATAAHMVGEEHRSAEDRMAGSMERLASIFELVAEKLGVTRQALDALKDKTVNVDVNIRKHGELDGTQGIVAGDQDQLPSYRGGSGGVLNYGSGTLAMLHGDEGVFTTGQLNSIVRGAARAGSQGGGFSGPMSAMGSLDAEILATLGDQTRLLAEMPAVLARTTRDAVVFGKVTVPR